MKIPRTPQTEAVPVQTRHAGPDNVSPRTWQAARVVSTLANPLVLCPLCFLGVAVRAAPRWPTRLKWWSLSCGLMTLVPLIHVRWGVRTGRLSDHDVSVRQERFVPYAAQIATVGATYGLLRVLRAPRLIIAVVVSVAGAMVVITGVTTMWKMSMHLMGAGGTVAVLTLVYGRRALPLASLIPLVGWSRYTLDHHTPVQAASGAAVGVLAPVLVFHVLRPLEKTS